MKNRFSEQFRTLRRERNMSQEQIAAALGVTAQAVSKWECAISYPDIEVLVALADLFGVSVDRLLRGTDGGHLPELPDDNTLRIVQVRGQTILRQHTYDPSLYIPLDVGEDNMLTLEIWGSADIKGTIGGAVTAGGSIDCATINGSVTAGCDVDCASVNGAVTAGCNVDCATVNGAVAAGGNVDAATVNGDVSAGGNIICEDIAGDVLQCGNISCDTIEGDILSCGGDIHCDDLEGDDLT